MNGCLLLTLFIMVITLWMYWLCPECTNRQGRTSTDVRACVCFCVRACLRACMRVFLRACVRACVRAWVYVCVCFCILECYRCIHTPHWWVYDVKNKLQRSRGWGRGSTDLFWKWQIMCSQDFLQLDTFLHFPPEIHLDTFLHFPPKI